MLTNFGLKSGLVCNNTTISPYRQRVVLDWALRFAFSPFAEVPAIMLSGTAMLRHHLYPQLSHMPSF